MSQSKGSQDTPSHQQGQGTDPQHAGLSIYSTASRGQDDFNYAGCGDGDHQMVPQSSNAIQPSRSQIQPEGPSVIENEFRDELSVEEENLDDAGPGPRGPGGPEDPHPDPNPEDDSQDSSSSGEGEEEESEDELRVGLAHLGTVQTETGRREEEV